MKIAGYKVSPKGLRHTCVNVGTDQRTLCGLLCDSSWHEHWGSGGLPGCKNCAASWRRLMRSAATRPQVGNGKRNPTLDGRIRKLVAEQRQHFEVTGQVKMYTLREIGGGIVTAERIRQISLVGMLKLTQRLARSLPDALDTDGINPAAVEYIRNADIEERGTHSDRAGTLISRRFEQLAREGVA